MSRTAAISTMRALAGSSLVVSVSMTTASSAIRGVALLVAAIGLLRSARSTVRVLCPRNVATSAGASMRLVNSSWMLQSVTRR